MIRAFASVSLAVFVLAARPASAFEVKTCEEQGVGLTSLVTPAAKNSVLLYDGKVAAYNIDTIEPACCSAGIAIVLPDREDESGGSACYAVTQVSSVDVTKAKRSYDAKKGLLLEMPVRLRQGMDDASDATLRLRVNLAGSTVTVEP